MFVLQPEEEEDSVDAASSDLERLCELFAQLTECKDDSQQRGWALHEDEQIITDNLEEMLSILVCTKLLPTSSYYLDTFYQNHAIVVVHVPLYFT